jgi:hypothetical protein
LSLSKSTTKIIDEHSFAMKIESLQEVESREKDPKDGPVKKVPVPMS